VRGGSPECAIRVSRDDSRSCKASVPKSDEMEADDAPSWMKSQLIVCGEKMKEGGRAGGESEEVKGAFHIGQARRDAA
jgi:hypothetical protein